MDRIGLDRPINFNPFWRNL